MSRQCEFAHCSRPLWEYGMCLRCARLWRRNFRQLVREIRAAKSNVRFGGAE